MEQEIVKPEFTFSVDTKLLYQAFIKLEFDETITFSQMTIVLGRPAYSSEGCIQTAKRKALKDDGIVLESVRGVGYIRLNDNDIAASSDKDVRRIGKAVRLSVRKQSCANFERLTNENKIKSATALSFFSTLAMMSKTEKLEKIEQAVGKDSKQISISQTLKLFNSD